MHEIPEVSPIRFDVKDVKGFKQHLTEHGCTSVLLCSRCLATRQEAFLPTPTCCLQPELWWTDVS